MSPPSTPPEPPATPGEALTGGPGLVMAAITLDEPAPGQTVSHTVHVRGTAQVFEGQIRVRVTAPGVAPYELAVQTGASAPDRSAFDLNVQLPEAFHGPATLTVFSTSARDGSPENVVEVGITVE